MSNVCFLFCSIHLLRSISPKKYAPTQFQHIPGFFLNILTSSFYSRFFLNKRIRLYFNYFILQTFSVTFLQISVLFNAICWFDKEYKVTFLEHSFCYNIGLWISSSIVCERKGTKWLIKVFFWHLGGIVVYQLIVKSSRNPRKKTKAHYSITKFNICRICS